MVEVSGKEQPLSEEAEATLLRTAQEALANVRKHAEADRVALTLSYMRERVMLDVRDDGAGFDAEAADSRPGETNGRSGGFGLAGMRERAEQTGGTLTVESAPGEGTTIALELPATGRVAGSEKIAAEARETR
jgi:signal transduction histidine kinase